MYALNVVNAFETDNGETICIDMNVYDNIEILRCWELKNMRTLEMPPWPHATVRRYVLHKIPEVCWRLLVDTIWYLITLSASTLSGFDRLQSQQAEAP